MNENPEADLAFNFLQNTGTNIFLTGKAGTGKTTFLKKLKELSPKRMIVVAPTGVAAINAGGVTIHSFFQIPFGPYIPSSGEKNNQQQGGMQNKFSKDKINIIRSMDLLVIDEISMVRADLLDAVSDVLKRYKDRNKPFGGVQLLLIGDIQQLAPVVKEEEWNLLKEHYDSTFFFNSKALRESHYLCIELKHVYRQDDPVFVSLLNNIRENHFDDNTLEQLNRRYIPGFRPKEGDGYITLTTHNYLAQQINNRKLEELPGHLYTFDAEIKDDFPAYSYPTDEKLELRCGAQVMFVKNDSSGEKRYYNGKIGKIVFINNNKILVTDEFGHEINVEKETWENVKYTIDPDTQEITETLSGTFKQYPLKTAWAITIHKSQGLTFEHAVIDASSAFSHGQVYVALSRCKTLQGLVLSKPVTRNAMINDLRIQDFTSGILNNCPGLEALREAQRSYFLELAVELFQFGSIQYRLQYASQAVYAHLQRLYPEMCNLYTATQNDFRTEVTEVGERFRQQLTRLIARCPDTYQEDAVIQERIQKGSDYFIREIVKFWMPLFKSSRIEIENKEARKAVTRAINNLAEEIQVKLQTLRACSEGFSVVRYLSAKAKATLNCQDTVSARKKFEKASSSSKGKETTIDTTYIKNAALYEELKKWREKKAAERDLPLYTVLRQRAMIGITNILPAGNKELLAIPGIGKKIVEVYGKELLEIVARYK
ncbi:HRDC domain-containing protein [Parabacteroides bouchesdurhonensis]|uniref:HRDC domain-containing protein n=1 Tax=Parabacteroides bouchesdurhonensis TaxID=1936995 RepID=UPI000C855EA1|nr:HRDC domain-containing protein [Parabacteroides bouchesdurhonensis]